MISVIGAFTSKEGVNIQLNMLRAIIALDSLINIAIPSIDLCVNELCDSSKFFPDCVGYQQYFHLN